jgi:hypothetical protein
MSSNVDIFLLTSVVLGVRVEITRNLYHSTVNKLRSLLSLPNSVREAKGCGCCQPVTASMRCDGNRFSRSPACADQTRFPRPIFV